MAGLGKTCLALDAFDVISLKAAAPIDYDLFLQLMHQEASDYIEESVEQLGLSWQEFDAMFRSVGSVRGIFDDNRHAGFVWTEQRDNVLHIHALVLERECQNRHLGREVMRMLEDECRDSCGHIEVGIHKSNERARRLCEKLGFEPVKTIDDIGFTILRKSPR